MTRVRSRYAPDDQIDRAAELSLKHGVRLKLNADGSVEVLGRLDSDPLAERAANGEGQTPDESLAAWEAAHGDPRHA